MTARIDARIGVVRLVNATGIAFAGQHRPDTARTAPTTTGFAESIIYSPTA
jgi:hypothetical protein